MVNLPNDYVIASDRWLSSREAVYRNQGSEAISSSAGGLLRRKGRSSQ